MFIIRSEFREFNCSLAKSADHKYIFIVENTGHWNTAFTNGLNQGYNARKVNCSCVYSAYILKPVLSGGNL